MNELKGFEPVAWVPQFSWQRSIDATACKSKRSFDDIPLFTAAQLADLEQQRDELQRQVTELASTIEQLANIGGPNGR